MCACHMIVVASMVMNKPNAVYRMHAYNDSMLWRISVASAAPCVPVIWVVAGMVPT